MFVRILALIVLCDLIIAGSFLAERSIADNYWEGEILVEAEYPVVLELPETHKVTVTIYNAVRGQTDSTPHILASGRHMNLNKIHEYRYAALSRDLLARWGGPFNYGDVIEITGAGNLDGFWVVQDSMNKRFKNRVDLLLPVGSPLQKHKDVTLSRV